MIFFEVYHVKTLVTLHLQLLSSYDSELFVFIYSVAQPSVHFYQSGLHHTYFVVSLICLCMEDMQSAPDRNVQSCV